MVNRLNLKPVNILHLIYGIRKKLHLIFGFRIQVGIRLQQLPLKVAKRRMIYMSKFLNLKSSWGTTLRFVFRAIW